MIILTGAAGFIGSCVLSQLNKEGISDIIIVDHWENNDPKKKNIADKKYAKYYDKTEFLELIKNDKLKDKVDCLIHMGACSSTILNDEDYYEKNNYEYSKILAEWAIKHKVRFIYASSAATYGDGALGYNDDESTIRKLKPLNLYGWSKQKFDLWVLNEGLADKVVGLKFFNVYGPNEYHKGEMRSVVAKSYGRLASEGKMVLFKSYRKDYKDGEQKRDFIYVKDAVDVVLYFMHHPKINGIFNLGSGQARTWNDLAKALFKAVGKPLNIEYIEMPSALRPQYQYFTEAKLDKLLSASMQSPKWSLEDGIFDYVSKYLQRPDPYL
jgi:ADP-L-glycero-D-manno-heptose 6-epimerase